MKIGSNMKKDRGPRIEKCENCNMFHYNYCDPCPFMGLHDLKPSEIVKNHLLGEILVTLKEVKQELRRAENTHK